MSASTRQLTLEESGNLQGYWDEHRLTQVVANLVGNALHHGASGCAVSVSLDGTAAKTVSLAVTNAGTIPPQILPHLFDPFCSARHPGHQPRGLGLGLYIVQQIVIAHGGIVQVESSEEQGTTIHVCLPRAQPGS